MDGLVDGWMNGLVDGWIVDELVDGLVWCIG